MVLLLSKPIFAIFDNLLATTTSAGVGFYFLYHAPILSSLTYLPLPPIFPHQILTLGINIAKIIANMFY